jgi:hypothetical protein
MVSEQVVLLVQDNLDVVVASAETRHRHREVCSVFGYMVTLSNNFQL